MSKVLFALIAIAIVAFVVDAVNQGKQQGQHLTGVNANAGVKVGKRDASFAGDKSKPKREAAFAGEKAKPKREAGEKSKPKRETGEKAKPKRASQGQAQGKGLTKDRQQRSNKKNNPL
ncbi:hypothetical protein AAVH_36814 [Aphelenchoides avenae]|nr:hypothetical protein AAVH_36814 [Aphelenchus avenae]